MYICYNIFQIPYGYVSRHHSVEDKVSTIDHEAGTVQSTVKKNYTYRLISVSVIFGFVLILHIYYRQATVDASIHLFNIKNIMPSHCEWSRFECRMRKIGLMTDLMSRSWEIKAAHNFQPTSPMIDADDNGSHVNANLLS